MNDILAKFSEIFIYNDIELGLLIAILLILIIQMYVYFRYYGKPARWYKKRSKLKDENHSNITPKVSVIVEAENEAEYLADLLPMLLTQNYPDFEVIVVNNGSTDETDMLLDTMEKQHKNLYHTFLPHSLDRYGFRKMALTIGIKAAKGDILLFTESYSRPVSENWIKSMVQEFHEDTEMVLGYSNLRRTSAFWTRIAAFDNLLFSLQYLSAAINKQTYTGTYRNMAFRRKLFFDNKGFSGYLYLENSEDIFINKVSTKTNTKVSLSPESFTETIAGKYGLWKQIKQSYSAARTCFKGNLTGLFSFEYFCRWCFIVLSIGGISYSAYNQHWAILGCFSFIFIISSIIKSCVIIKASKHFKSGKFYSSLIICGLLQPLYNLKLRNKVKSPTR